MRVPIPFYFFFRLIFLYLGEVVSPLIIITLPAASFFFPEWFSCFQADHHLLCSSIFTSKTSSPATRLCSSAKGDHQLLAASTITFICLSLIIFIFCNNTVPVSALFLRRCAAAQLRCCFTVLLKHHRFPLLRSSASMHQLCSSSRFC